MYYNQGIIKKKMKSTALGIPRRSPIQVLTEPDVAYEDRCFQRSMAVDITYIFL